MEIIELNSSQTETNHKSFNTYPKYKDTNATWIGKIPHHWETKKLKFVAPERSEKLSERPSKLPYVGLENIESWTGRINLDVQHDIVDSQVIRFQAGDVLLGKLRPYLAKVIKAEFEGVGTTELLSLRPNRDIIPSFLFYQLLNKQFVHLVAAMTYGAKMPRANWEQIGNIKFPIPNLSEQRAIATFLDHQTTKIDALIAKKKRLIELLQEKCTALISQAVTKGLNPDVPMKDSGIDWLGEIPAYWNVSSIGKLYDIKLGKMLNSNIKKDSDLIKPYLRAANIFWEGVDISNVGVNEMGFDMSQLNRYRLIKNDLLITEGGTVGRSAIWNDELSECYYQNSINRARSLGIVPIKFLYYEWHEKSY
jgi:type I restriction enzyme, S subunit